jgi:predicted amidohydrolase
MVTIRSTITLGALMLAASPLAAQTFPIQPPMSELPRKVVVGTAVYPIYQFPGKNERIGDLEGLIDKMGAAAERQYPGEGLDLVVLPEEALTLGSGRSPSERAVALDGPELKRLSEKARRWQTYVVAPLTLTDSKRQNIVYNAAVLLDRSGSPVGIYRKVHPVAGKRSDLVEDGITPGSDFPVFTCDFGRVGIQICWDMSYEDGWIALARQGAEIVAVPSASPQTVRPAAYALHGRYYVVTSTPRNNASIFNPVGRIEAQTKENGVVVHRVDLSYALINWSATLGNGAAFRKKYGDKAGYLYYEDEDCGIFWSNDPAVPVKRMVQELGEMEIRDQVARSLQVEQTVRQRNRGPENAGR